MTVKDSAGNPGAVSIAFPPVTKGAQDLSGFTYSAASVTFGDSAPTVTPPTGAPGAFSYAAAPASVCTVDPSTGVLALVGAGTCTVTLTAASTADYDGATYDAVVTVRAVPVLALTVNTPIATDNIINITEKANGFMIAGATGDVEDVTVRVTLGDHTFADVLSVLTDHDADANTAEQAAWSVTVPVAAAYIAGTSVAVEVNASKTGYPAVSVQRTLTVDLVAPSLKLATVFDSTLTLTYDEPLDEGSVPSSGAFSVSVNGAPVSVVSNSVAVNNVTLRLASAVAAGSTVTVSYTKPAGNPIRDAAGNAAANLMAQMVEGPPSDSTETETAVDRNLPAQNIIWTEIGDNSPRHGMPIGNGTYSALVWAARDDDILLLLGAGDFWDEYVHLNHPGRIRISYSTNPFASGEPFRQELKIKEAEIVITAGSNPEITTRIWADANEQVIHVESERTAGTGDYTMTVNFESLRPTTTVARTNPGNLSIRRNYSDMDGSPYTPMKPADTMETVGNLVYWYQRNDQSYFDEIINLQGLNASDYTDILTGRTYGGRLDGDGFTASGTAITKTGGSGRVAITLHSKVSDSVATWRSEINAAAIPFSTPIETLRTAHRDWWSKFWYRSYIFASGDSDATDLTHKVRPGTLSSRLRRADTGHADPFQRFHLHRRPFIKVIGITAIGIPIMDSISASCPGACCLRATST